jgi:hypothetical protein
LPKDTLIAPDLKKQWLPTRRAFQGLLAWLDAGVDSRGATYLEMRRRLAAYFARKRCLEPDRLAGETLNRVARSLEKQLGTTGIQPAYYCYSVATAMLHEDLRRAEEPHVQPSAEDCLECLDRCLRELSPRDRSLVLEYYRGGERVKLRTRAALAEQLDTTPDALSGRACRIRNRLESCVKACRVRSDCDMFLLASSRPE